MSAADNDPFTIEDAKHGIEKMIYKLENRMIKVRRVMKEINTLVGAAQTMSESHRRIQKERRQTLRAHASKHMKDILRRQMIFNHDTNRILKKYEPLIGRMRQCLESFDTPTSMDNVKEKTRNIIESFYKREELYKRIVEEYPRLKATIENTHGNETNNENSNMNTHRTPMIRFGDSTVRRIPHKGDLIVMGDIPPKNEVSASSAASSSGGTRRKKRTKRTLRKKRNRV